MKNQKNLVVIGAILAGIATLAFLAILLSGRKSEDKNISAVAIQKNGGQLIVRRDGSVTYVFGDDSYSDTWDQDKTDAFFKHFEDTYLVAEGEYITGGQNSVTVIVNGSQSSYVLDDDELVDVVIDDTTGGGGGPGGTGGTGGSGGSGGSGGTGGTSSPGGGTSTPGPTMPPYGPDPNCLFWRLSYCVRPRTPTPTPVQTTTAVIRPPDCTENIQTGRTVISNELCVPTPSPTPTP